MFKDDLDFIKDFQFHRAYCFQWKQLVKYLTKCYSVYNLVKLCYERVKKKQPRKNML